MPMLQFLTFLLLPLLQQAASPPSPPASPAAAATFRVSGKVVDAVSGQPLALAFVALTPSGSPNVRNNRVPPDSGLTQITNDAGAFAFDEVPEGKYILSARHRGYVMQMFQQHEGFTTAIVVGPGLESQNLVFALRTGASISGEVVDESDDPVRHADVMLFHQAFSGGLRRTFRFRQVSTDDEGRYHFSHLGPGSYFVGVSAQPWYAQRGFRQRRLLQNAQETSGEQFFPMIEQNQNLDVVYPVAFFSNGSELATATPITLHSGDTAIADFRMRPVPSMHVLVRAPVSDPQQSTNINVTQNIAEGETVWVPVQSFQLAPGLMEVAGVPQGRFNLILNTFGGTATTHRLQSVQVENDGEVDATRNTASVVVSGVLGLEGGSPLPQPARVRLLAVASREVFDAPVSATGEFSFKDHPVEPGKYEIMIIEPQGLFIRSLASNNNVKTSGRSFEIVVAQDVSVTINASKGSGRITGIALKKDKPVSGVMIVLAPIDLKSNPALFRRDQSDSDGTFGLNLVVPGQYTLMAIEDGWDLEWADPAVLQKYIAGGENVKIAPNEKTEVQVKVQQK